MNKEEEEEEDKDETFSFKRLGRMLEKLAENPLGVSLLTVFVGLVIAMTRPPLKPVAKLIGGVQHPVDHPGQGTFIYPELQPGDVLGFDMWVEVKPQLLGITLPSPIKGWLSALLVLSGLIGLGLGNINLFRGILGIGGNK